VVLCGAALLPLRFQTLPVFSPEHQAAIRFFHSVFSDNDPVMKGAGMNPGVVLLQCIRSIHPVIL
jgi:hypothetical protein